MFTRNETNVIKAGNVHIGGGNPVTVQSMTNTDTRNASATIKQIQALSDAGCQIVRVAVPDMEAAESLKTIKKGINIPLVADIHFDHRLALKAVDAGIDKLRINPGNIGSDNNVRELANAAKNASIPIRVGVNSGSLKKELLDKYGRPSPKALVESALDEIRILNDADFFDICVSIKSSSAVDTIEAYTLFSEESNVPLHVGITEAGTLKYGTIKSACGIGAILSRGIGDTIRVSLTSDPVNEIFTGIMILKSLGLRKESAEVISCPTCGRTEIDIIGLAEEVERRSSSIKKPIIIAVMGCVVNGPGEAKEADYGIAGGKGVGLVFRKGEIVKKVKENELTDSLFEIINSDINA